MPHNKNKPESSETEFFYHLTPDVVMDAVEEAGLHPSGHCRALNSLENRVFDIGLDDGAHVVAKFYRPGRWSREQILEEHQFLMDLKEAEIPVLWPVPFPDGQTLKTIQGIHYAIWPLTGGREPSEFTETELEITGRLLARIHNTGAAGKTVERFPFATDRLCLEPLRFLMENDFLPSNIRLPYEKAVLDLVSLYNEISEDVPVLRIHGDCHIGNLLYGKNGWYFLDFDDFCTGPAVQDVWLISSGRDQEALYRQEIFLNAYRTFRDFNDSWLKLVEPLRAIRYIYFSGWIARRWSDPAFPLAFPHFGSEEYWEGELKELKGQLSLCAGNGHYFFPDTGADKEDQEQELTNKDFFWDLED